MSNCYFYRQMYSAGTSFDNEPLDLIHTHVMDDVTENKKDFDCIKEVDLFLTDFGRLYDGNAIYVIDERIIFCSHFMLR